METVRINKGELLKVVQENREKHKTAYDSACVIYREEVVKSLKKLLKDAKKSDVPVSRIRTNVGLPVPTNSLGEYDRVIAMLTRSVDDIIELTAHEFSQYVLDEWHWKAQFETSTMSYNSMAAARNFRKT